MVGSLTARVRAAEDWMLSEPHTTQVPQASRPVRQPVSQPASQPASQGYILFLLHPSPLLPLLE